MRTRALRTGLIVALVAFAAVFPLLVDNVFYLSVGALALIYITLGLGMNVVMGHTGLTHAGYAAFYGIGGYTVAVLMVRLEWSFWPALVVACILSAVIAVVIGIPAIRVSEIYFILVTLGFAEIIRITAVNTAYLGGPDGVFGVPAPTIGDVTIASPESIYWLILAGVLVSMLAMSRLSNSRIVRAWNYLREDESAAQVLGVDPVWGKLQATFLAGMWAGLGGAFFAIRQTAVSPSAFDFFTSFTVILVVAIGGLRSLPGVLLGTGVIIVLPEVLRPLQEYRLILFGIVIIVMMLFRPDGVWPGDIGKRYKSIADSMVGDLPARPSAEAE